MEKIIKTYIDRSVLCWLATSDAHGKPNVSPKEMFTYVDDAIVIANIASPRSVKNIKENRFVSVSFIDVFVQKGYKILGEATLIHQKDADFDMWSAKLKKMAGDDFPFMQVIKIKVLAAETIIAPRYQLFPDTTEEAQIESALETYKVAQYGATTEKDFVSNYLESVNKQFQYYKQLGDKTFEQLNDEELFMKDSDAENSIANIVFHLYGNMMSRWTDFLTTDGEKDFRDRDREFEDTLTHRNDLLSVWNKGWTCLFTALETITVENFDTIVYIRNMGHSITEAINRQLAHYSYHVGQIVLLGKSIKKDDWTSLSIPKGDSQKYNKEKFSQDKRRAHFTDEFLDQKE